MNNKSNAVLTNSGDLFNIGGTLRNYFQATLTNDGTMANNGGLLTNDLGGIIDGTGTYTQSTQPDGRTVNNGTMTQESFRFNGGTLSSTGILNGPVTIASMAVVHPGNPTGTLTINGTYSSSGIHV